MKKLIPVDTFNVIVKQCSRELFAALPLRFNFSPETLLLISPSVLLLNR